jgi:hypothetical protein
LQRGVALERYLRRDENDSPVETIGMAYISCQTISDADGFLDSGIRHRRPRPLMKKSVWRAVIETGFIIFLFYANLLMGEFERSGLGQKRGFVWAINDIFTRANFAIALVAALVGYVLFEFLRKRF